MNEPFIEKRSARISSPRVRSIVLVLSAAFGLAACAALPQRETRTISVADLEELPVIGKLGVPLGTGAEIEAIVISGESLRMNIYDSRYLLKVTTVNSKPLANPVTLEFVVPGFISADLASNVFDLHELKTGKKTGLLTSSKIGELEKGYVGKVVRIAVYEGGRFDGFPNNNLPGVPIWADVSFCYTSYLVVIADRDRKPDSLEEEEDR